MCAFIFCLHYYNMSCLCCRSSWAQRKSWSRSNSYQNSRREGTSWTTGHPWTQGPQRGSRSKRSTWGFRLAIVKITVDYSCTKNVWIRNWHTHCSCTGFVGPIGQKGMPGISGRPGIPGFRGEGGYTGHPGLQGMEGASDTLGQFGIRLIKPRLKDLR